MTTQTQTQTKRGYAIYGPKGRAGEYAKDAVNLYDGCGHGCEYPCYAADIRRRTLEDFSTNVRPFRDILERLEKDCRRIAGENREVYEAAAPVRLIDGKLLWWYGPRMAESMLVLRRMFSEASR